MLPATLWTLLLLFLSAFLTLVRAQGSVQSFFPASVPLSVRTPYLSTWTSTTSTSPPLTGSWPLFWGQSGITGWSGKIRVDGQPYVWMGADRIPVNESTVSNVQITPTRAIYVMQAGPVNFTVTFLSPIEPDDWVKQTIPFTYVSVEVNSLDGNAHSVQVYSDISAEWVSGNRSSSVKWSNQITGSSVFHEIELQDPQANVEINHQAQDGKAYYAMASRPGLTWQIDGDVATRTQFATQGSLTNTASTAFAPISPVFSVFAISVDLGTITSTSSPVTWAVGYVRDPVIRYTAFNGETQDRRPYYTTKYSDIGSVIDDFTADFSAALNRAIALDKQIMSAAAKISTNYVDLVSLSARQAMSGLDITVGSDASDVLIFMKDVGTSQRVNPVEKMYAAFPAYLYLNASLGAKMLEPLLDAQDDLSGQAFAAQDLGLSYPIASGTRGPHTQGIEQSGNMLIMLLAQARVSGDGTLLFQHYNLTKRWADYLVNNTLTPTNQATADSETNANMTNLAIKGIIGVKAMAEIARALDKDADAQNYDSKAATLLASWISFSVSSDRGHLLGQYNQQTSWALLYNIYADVLLGTDLITSNVMNAQTQFYKSILSQAPTFGLPIDSTAGQTSSMAWFAFTSATVSDNSVRDQFLQGAWARANSNNTAGALPDHYNNGNGNILDGTSGPSAGAMFAHLALTVANTTITVPTSALSGSSGKSDATSTSIAPIVGGVVGGVAVLAIAVGAIIFFRRKRRYTPSEDGEKAEVTDPAFQPTPYSYGYANTQSFNAFPQASGGGAPSIRSYQSPASEYTIHTLPNPYSDVGGPTISTAAVGAGAATVAGAAMTGAGSTRGSPTRRTFQTHSPHPSIAYSVNAPSAQGLPYIDTSVTMSAKARERLLNMQPPYQPQSSQPQPHPYAQSIAGSETTGSAAHTVSSRDPLSPETGSGASAAGTLSPTEMLGLRAEVENLRRVMQEIRAERFEPPPEYAG